MLIIQHCAAKIGYKVRQEEYVYYTYCNDITRALICTVNIKLRRSQWSRGLRRGSAVDRLLGFRVRIIQVARCLS